jgi:penicillin-insensitive murein endopeptidase
MRSVLLLVLLSHLPAAISAESVCFGTTGAGRLEGGVQLPGDGPNFVSYGTIPELMGRTYVHSKVRDVIVSAYELLEVEAPGKVFEYAETGAETGGEFSPHKTHQNGLSVDLIVPVTDSSGESVHLPTHALNRYGYDIEFDQNGRYGDYQMDFDALGAKIVALHKSAKKHRVKIWRVLFDPKLQAHLYKTRHGSYIRTNVLIPTKRSWVRHDDHIHIDFKVECRAL